MDCAGFNPDEYGHFRERPILRNPDPEIAPDPLEENRDLGQAAFEELSKGSLPSSEGLIATTTGFRSLGLHEF